MKRNLFSIAVILLSLFFLVLCCGVMLMSYDALVERVVAVLQKPGLEGLIRSKALTARKFRWIQIFCTAGLLLVPALAFAVLRKAGKVMDAVDMVSGSVRSGYRAVAEVYAQNTAAQNGSVAVSMGVVLIKCLYYIHTWDLQYDEMWCYNYLTARPFYFTLFAYNNYPLYELSTHVFKLLPFSMKTDLRLPVLITGMLSCVLLYACLRKYCRTHGAALGGMLVFAFMPVTTMYMLYARGVIFESFFAVAAIFSLLFWIRSGSSRWMVLFSLANALGMYAMPTHLYLWAMLFALGAAACLRHRREWRPFLIGNGSTLLLSVLLYLPVLLGSGFSFVAEAVAPRYSYSQIIPNIPAFVASYSSYFTGFRAGMAGVLAIATGFLLNQRKARDPVVLPLIAMLCLFPLLAYVVQKMVVPYRASGFVALAVPLIFAILFQHLQGSLGAPVQWAVLLLAAALLGVVSHRCHDMNWSRPRDREAVRLAGLFMHRGVRSFYDNSPGSGFFYFYPALEYYYAMHHKKIDFSVAAPNSIRFRPLRQDGGYDCIVYRADTPRSRLPAQYTEIWANPVLNYRVMLRDGRVSARNGIRKDISSLY